MEPSAAWEEQEQPGYWEHNTKRAKSTEQTFLVDQRTLFGYYDQPCVGSRMHFGLPRGFQLSMDHSISVHPYFYHSPLGTQLYSVIFPSSYLTSPFKSIFPWTFPDLVFPGALEASSISLSGSPELLSRLQAGDGFSHSHASGSVLNLVLQPWRLHLIYEVTDGVGVGVADLKLWIWAQMTDE